MTSPALIAPIQAIVDLLHPVLVFFHDKVGVGWGMSIVLLTICIRAVLTPLMVKQFKSMKAMISYAPQIKAVQEKYKDDKERQRQEVMKVYQENKINPFASCLPILMQLPFFIGLFYLLGNGGPLRSDICGQRSDVCGDVESAMSGAEKFLFIPDLTDKATGGVLVALIVLYISSQLLSGILTPSTGDRNAKLLMYGLPFIFTPIIIGFPAGLIVYWITTNLWTVGQGYILRKRLGPIRPAEDAPTPAKAAGDEDEGPRKGLMARLADATANSGGANANSGGADANSGGAGTKAGAGANSGGADANSGGAGTKAGAGAKTGGAGAKSGGAGAKSGGAGSKTASPAPKPARSGPPPQPPRKKKKRSGRRR